MLPNCPQKTSDHTSSYPNQIITIFTYITHLSNPSNSVYKTGLICADAGYHIRHNTTVVVNYARGNITHISGDIFIPVGGGTQHLSMHEDDEMFTNLLT